MSTQSESRRAYVVSKNTVKAIDKREAAKVKDAEKAAKTAEKKTAEK